MMDQDTISSAESSSPSVEEVAVEPRAAPSASAGEAVVVAAAAVVTADHTAEPEPMKEPSTPQPAQQGQSTEDIVDSAPKNIRDPPADQSGAAAEEEKGGAVGGAPSANNGATGSEESDKPEDYADKNTAPDTIGISNIPASFEAVEGSNALYSRRQVETADRMERQQGEEEQRRLQVEHDRGIAASPEVTTSDSGRARRLRRAREEALAAERASASAASGRPSQQQQSRAGRDKVVTSERAVVLLQSAFRAIRVRRRLRRRAVAAVEIQRVARGRIARRHLTSRRGAHGVYLNRGEDADRSKRLSRIRRQEQELALLKKLPAKEFVSFNQVRRVHASKAIQRWWRRRGSRTRAASVAALTPVAAAVTEADVATCRSLARKVMAQAHTTPSSQFSLTASKANYETMDLVLIMDRIKAKCAERRAEDVVADKIRGPVEGGGPGGGARSKYQELFDARVRADTCLEDFNALMESEQRSQKYERQSRLERVKSLMSELKTAPSLNDALLSMPSKQLSSNPVDSAAAARFKSFVRGAFDGRSLSAQAQQRSVEDRALAHIETFRKVRAIRQRKWYASMYIDRNVAEPIALVPAAEERSAVAKSDAQTAPGRRGTHSKGTAPFDRSRMAYDWKEGYDAKESLRWLSYITSPSSLTAADDKGSRNGAQSDLIRANIGSVDVDTLLKQITIECMQPEKRAADVRALAASQSEREAELARTVLREGAALRSHSASAKAKSEKQFKLDEQMNVAAARIQGLYRGVRDRRQVHSIRAEERVLNALKVLVSELGNPELQGRGRAMLGELGAAQVRLPKAPVATQERGGVRRDVASFVSGPASFAAAKHTETVRVVGESSKRGDNTLAHALRSTLRPTKSDFQKSVRFESPTTTDGASFISSGSIPMSQQTTEPRLVAVGTRQFDPYEYHVSESPYFDRVFGATRGSSVETPMRGSHEQAYISPPSSLDDDPAAFAANDIDGDSKYEALEHEVDAAHESMRAVPSSRQSRAAPGPVAPLRIPKLSRSAVTAMKRAAEVVFSGGTPIVEGLIDEGMALPPEMFNKALGCQILQDLVLICGVNPMLGWLESYANSTVGPMQIPCVPVDLTCSLLSQLALELGVLPPTDSLSAASEPGLSVVHLCCLLRLASSGYSGGGDEVSLPLPDLGGILEDDWLAAATKPPAVGDRLLRLLSGCRSALLAIEISERGSRALSQVLLECSGCDTAPGSLSASAVRALVCELGARVQSMSPPRVGRFDIESLTEQDAENLIIFCNWDSNATAGPSVAWERLEQLLCTHPMSTASLLKKLQVLFHALPSAPQALAAEAVVQAGGRRGVDAHAVLRAIERASPALPISRTEAEGLVAFLGHRSGAIELPLLDDIKRGSFGLSASSQS